MSKDNYRSIGALIGLALGLALMGAFKFGGLVPSAIFGAGGCVAGAITAERLYAWKQKRDG